MLSAKGALLSHCLHLWSHPLHTESPDRTPSLQPCTRGAWFCCSCLASLLHFSPAPCSHACSSNHCFQGKKPGGFTSLVGARSEGEETSAGSLFCFVSSTRLCCIKELLVSAQPKYLGSFLFRAFLGFFFFFSYVPINSSTYRVHYLPGHPTCPSLQTSVMFAVLLVCLLPLDLCLGSLSPSCLPGKAPCLLSGST